MAEVVLPDEQARAVQAANGAVEVRDRRGNLLGYVATLPSAAEL